MSIRVLPHASDLRRTSARETSPGDPRTTRNGRRIRDDARDGLAAAAVSLGGSITVTLAVALLLRWLA